jgi:hypothetical protein
VTQSHFLELAKAGYRRIPVLTEARADLHTHKMLQNFQQRGAT